MTSLTRARIATVLLAASAWRLEAQAAPLPAWRPILDRFAAAIKTDVDADNRGRSR